MCNLVSPNDRIDSLPLLSGFSKKSIDEHSFLVAYPIETDAKIADVVGMMGTTCVRSVKVRVSALTRVVTEASAGIGSIRDYQRPVFGISLSDRSPGRPPYPSSDR